MEYTFRVITKKVYLPLQYRFQDAFLWFSEHNAGLTINPQILNDEVMFLLRLSISRETEYFNFQEMRDIFIHHMAEFLSEHIVRDWEEYLIKDQIEKYSGGLDNLEKAYVYRAARDFLNLSTEEENVQELVAYSRKSKICVLIAQHLRFNNELHAEGFIRFQLKEYKKEIEYTTLYVLDKFKRKEIHELLSGVLKLLYISRYLH